MNTLTALLGGGALTTIVLGFVDRIRNRKFDRRKQDTTIKLDEAQYDEIRSRAETTNNANLMAVGAFWQGQFNELAKQVESLEKRLSESEASLVEERDWRRRAKDRWHEHYVWDRKMLAGDPNPGLPPSLDPDE